MDYYNSKDMNERGDSMVANKVNLFPFTSNALFQLTTCEQNAFKMLFKQIIDHNQTLKERFGGDRQSIIIIRDIWFLLLHEKATEQNFEAKCKRYPMCYLYIRTLLASEDVKAILHRTRNDEQLSLLYAIIYIEYFNEWLKQKVSTSQLLKYHLRIIDFFYQETVLNFPNFFNDELIIPRHVVFSEIGLASEVKYLSSTKYCELKMKLHDAFRSIKKIENVISCKNHISKKRILLPQHLSDLFSIFYARTPILQND